VFKVGRELEDEVTKALATSPRDFFDTPFIAESREDRIEREQFFKTAFEEFDDDIPRSRKEPNEPDELIEANPEERARFNYENNLTDLELARIIAKELKEKQLVPQLAQYHEKQIARTRPQHPHLSHNLMLGIPEWEKKVANTVPDRPAVALPDPKPFKPAKKPISKVSPLHPIAFEYNTYPGSFLIHNPFHSRKVILYVNVAALNMPKHVRNRLVQLCSHKNYYDAQKNMLVIKSQIKNTLRSNKQKVIQIFRELVSEAWKMDLNYMYPPDKLPPHQLIEKEVADKKREEEEEYLNSFEQIKQKSTWTLFRYRELPSNEILQESTSNAQRTSQKLLKTLNEM
jgi:hypothetical protein